MKSLLTSDAYNEALDRLEALRENSGRKWGTMTVAQMLYHCQFPLNLALGRFHMEKPPFFRRLLFKAFKPSMYNDKPWKKNMPTPPDFRVKQDKDFSKEKTKLKQCIVDFHTEKDRKEWNPHPAFGRFTPQQWGQMQYKHLDHHFRQFGV